MYSLTLFQHDGLENKHGWLLKEIEVTNMTEKKSWMFSCQQWLSLYEGDLMIKKNLRAVQIEKQLTGIYIQINVSTIQSFDSLLSIYH